MVYLAFAELAVIGFLGLLLYRCYTSGQAHIERLLEAHREQIEVLQNKIQHPTVFQPAASQMPPEQRLVHEPSDLDDLARVGRVLMGHDDGEGR